MLTSNLKTIVCVGCLSFALSACASNDPVLRPSGKAAFVPADNVAFTQYVKDSRANIELVLNQSRPPAENRPYLGDYTNQDAAKMRSPFQIPELDTARCDDISKGAGKGFLLIHGLTDSPYLMRSISDSLSNEYPCALIRAILLPGHGTVAGDSLKMSYKDWQRITSYGVNSFKEDPTISELYLVGFSTGTSLTIKYMKENPGNSEKPRKDKIKGLVLISTAVKANTWAALLAPIAKIFKDWDDTFQEKDAARYESFSLNAGAEFYKLTKGMVTPQYALDVPVLMAVSADDETIDAMAARKFFCYPTDEKRRALVWYQSIDPKVNAAINPVKTPELMCDNIVEIKLDNIAPNFKTVNLAHTALSMAPEDPHYGVDGKYHNCKAYENKKTTQEFDACQGDKEKNIFGEKNIDKLSDKLKEQLGLDYAYLRRGTFNPDYKNLETRILCFTNDKCLTSNLLSSE